MKILKEWFVEAPWGKIALVSWGTPTGQPLLLVHGRQDSAATFIPLMEHLPDSFYYVAVDLPGHGRSEPMPTGVMLTRFHLFAGVDYAVRHLKWDTFLFIGHSMGCEQGLFYNVIYPGKIQKFMFLDPIPSLQRHQIQDFEKYYAIYYAEYYNNYKLFNNNDRVCTKRKALDAVVTARGLDEKLAEIVLSRNMWPVDDDKYRLSWDRRLKMPATKNYSPDYYYELFSRNTPPTLIVNASDYPTVVHGGDRRTVEELIFKLQKNTEDLYIETVKGGHDVHLTSPKVVGQSVARFLNSKFGKAKL